MAADRVRRSAGLALVGLLLAGACGQEPAPDVVAWARAVDQALAAAEGERAAGHLDAARVALEAAVAAPSPDPEAPLVVALRENAWFALGRVHFEAGRPREALAAADRGLALREDPAAATVFTASLHALRGLSLAALDRPDDAIAAWEAAQIIHARLFERALAAPPEEAAP